MLNKLILFSILFSIITQTRAQQHYNFGSPLDIPLLLAGNCGEIRPNHFHTGIDIKTKGVEGLNIYSVEDGYISRIRVSPYGYGHAVYVTHYNGLTSVYAHCKGFSGEVQKLAYSQQKKQQNFEIDYQPTKDSLKVKKGDLIAISGNTGGSSAPHLHFELRDTKTENAVNPLLYGFDIKDTITPTIRSLKIYGLTKEGYRVPGKAKKYTVTGSLGNYRIGTNTATINSSYCSEEGGIGFAFDVYDRLNGAPNICGIFEAFLLVNGDTVFTQNMTEISFYSFRQVNTHVDYEEFKNGHKYYHKAFKTIHNPLPIYRKNINNGIIKAIPGKTYDIRYIVKDVHGNESNLFFSLKVEEGEITQKQILYPGKQTLTPDSSFLSYDKNYYIMFPSGILYEPTPLLLQANENNISFGNPAIPLQSTFKIMLPITNNEVKPNKFFIQRNSSSEKGTVKDGWITSRVKSFGTFSVQIDTLPPKIFGRNFSNNSTVGHRKLTWNINDEGSGIVDYDIFIDETWYLLEYEPKQASYFFIPPKSLSGTKFVIIRARDHCGNTGEAKYTLTF